MLRSSILVPGVLLPAFRLHAVMQISGLTTEMEQVQVFLDNQDVKMTFAATKELTNFTQNL